MEPAERTPFPLGLVDVTRPLGHARVHFLVLDGPLEEAFARLAREQTVMVTRHLVAAHGTQFLDALLGVGQLGTGGGRIDGGRGGGRGGHGRAASAVADGHVLRHAVHGARHAAVGTCGTEQIRCVHITQLITVLLVARAGGAHHRVRGRRAGRGRLLVLGRTHVLVVQGRRRRRGGRLLRLVQRVVAAIVAGRLWRA